MEGSQLGCVGSANKLQKHKRGSWSLREKKGKVRHLWGRSDGRERSGCAPERESAPVPAFFRLSVPSRKAGLMLTK